MLVGGSEGVCNMKREKVEILRRLRDERGREKARVSMGLFQVVAIRVLASDVAEAGLLLASVADASGPSTPEHAIWGARDSSREDEEVKTSEMPPSPNACACSSGFAHV